MISAPTSTDTPTPGRVLRILVVEDHTALGRTIAKLLQVRGHKVALVSTHDHALERAMDHTFDLLFCDCSFSAQSDALAKNLRALQPDLRAIAVSGFSTAHETHACFDLHIVRPTRMAEIDDAISRLFPDVLPHAASPDTGSRRTSL